MARYTLNLEKRRYSTVDLKLVLVLGSLGDNQLKISLQDLLNAEHQGKNIIIATYIASYTYNSIMDMYGSQVDGG